MIMFILGQLWLIMAALTVVFSIRATYRDWGYNKNITTGGNMAKRNKNPVLKTVKATRGIERAAHFENGGDLVSWRGGPRTVTVDRKKQQSKRACRGKWQ